MTDNAWRDLFDGPAPQCMNDVFTSDGVREAESLVGAVEPSPGAGGAEVELDEMGIKVVVRRPPA